MKILMYDPYPLDNPSMSVMLDEAVEYLKDPCNTVLFLTCSGQIAPCELNAEQSPIRCTECRFSTRLLFRRHQHPRLVHKTLSDFLDSDAENRVARLQLECSSIENVKHFTHLGVNIGLGVVSSYVSMTRNINPAFNRETRHYLQAALHAAARLAEAACAAILEFRPDRICLFNGRFGGVRPVVEVARAKDVPFTVLEVTFSSSRETYRKIRVPDGLPHEIDKITPLIEEYWSNGFRQEGKETRAAAFFEARRRGEMASDNVHTSLQDPARLPADWDSRRRNFVIFNSSEDEFFAIGDSFDRHRLFPNQIMGIEYLVEMCAADPAVHVYLRIHPNLRRIRFRYHTSLTTRFGRHSNITVIPADSPVSTYTLLDNCEKVFVFGSTVGVEAAYWGKPVILMGSALYMHLDVAYVPRRLSELEELVLPRLEAKPKLGALKYALYLFGERGDSPSHVDFNQTFVTIGKKTLPVPLAFRLLGSIFPYKCGVALFRLSNLMLHLYFKSVTMRKLCAEVEE